MLILQNRTLIKIHVYDKLVKVGPILLYQCSFIVI